MENELVNLRYQGIKINYFFICERKLWLFDKGITMEQNSDKVLQGRILHETSYQKEEKKEILFDDIIRIDIIGDDTIREVKYSSKMKEADLMQLYYYLFYLKQKGIVKKGIVNYPKEKRREFIELNENVEQEVIKALIKINEIVNMPYPPKAEKSKKCKSCAYYEFCWG